MLAPTTPSVVNRTSEEASRRRDRSTSGPASWSGYSKSRYENTSSELHLSLSELYANQTRWLFTSARDKISLLERCIESVAGSARDWVNTACEIKHIPSDSPCRSEEILAGPVVAMRYLRLMLRNLRSMERSGAMSFPGRLTRADDGRWRVPVLPVTRDLYDPVCFVNFQANVWLRAGLCEDEAMAATQPVETRLPSTSLILGAGNVSGIVAADTLGKLFQDQQVALLKLHPLTETLGPVLRQAFTPLIDAGCLRIISGGSDVGELASRHSLVDDIHMTGSEAAHSTLVWGPPGPDRNVRCQDNEPLLDKPITSELGNVTPWVIVPGQYTPSQLQAQVDNVAASIVNNAGFNCVSTRVLVTWKHWPQREEFLSRLQVILSRLPRRVAYYPGAVERFERFTGCRLSGWSWSMAREGDVLDEPAANVRPELPRLPWTLFRDVNPNDSPLFCREESFVPVCAEMPLDATDEFDFLGQATDFLNEQLWGTLCATLSVPMDFRRSARGRHELHAALTRLRYGTVCINQWPGIAFALLTSPWGGHPSSTLLDPQSGLGWVHNTFGLRSIEKTVLEGPLTVVPKPIWTPGHPHAETIAWKLLDLYHRPSLRQVADLSYTSFVAHFLPKKSSP